MKVSKNEVETLRAIVKKLENIQKGQKIRIQSRRKAQLKGKTINKGIGKKKKPVRVKRKVTKKRASIR